MTAGAAFPVRANLAWRLSGLFLSTVVLAVLVAWCVMLLDRGHAVAAGGALLLALPVAALAAGRRQPEGWLSEAADGWRFEPAATGEPARAGELVVALDFSDWMLLRLRSPGRRWQARDPWFAVSRRDMAASWHPFRRAVYSPRPLPAGPSAQAPADPPA